MKTRSSVFWDYYRWPGIYENIPHLTDTQTHRHKLISLTLALIPLLFTPHASPPRLPASLDFCALLRGKLLPLLLLSFFVFFNTILIFFFDFFNFCLIWSEEYVLKVEICYQNTKQHWSATKNHQVPTEAFIFINFFFLPSVGKKFSDLACFCFLQLQLSLICFLATQK